MAQMAAAGNHKRYFDANLATHEAVLDCAGNRWQKNVIQYLRSMCRLYPYVSAGTVPGRLEQSLHEHQDLLAAIEANDPARAEEVMRRHITNTRKALKQLAA
jgi:DNA-binding GntR family transcriptional regulator